MDINKRKRTNSDGGTNKIPSEKVKESLESDEYPLHTAILKKDYTTVKKLLKNQAVLNEKDKDGNTPLHIAVKHNQLNTVQLLLDKKADPLYENDKNQTPLDLAVIHDRCDIVIHLTQVIKNKSKQLGADLKTIFNKTIDNDNKDTLLHYIIRNDKLNIVQLLLTNDTDPNKKDKDGNTPLHIAVKENKFDIIKLLLKNSDDLLIKNDLQQTTLDLAVIADYESIFIKLIQFFIKNKSKQGGANLNKTEINKKIGDEENTLLHYIVCKKNDKTNEIVQWLLEQGAYPNIQNKCGYVPLHYVINDDNWKLYDLLLQHNAHLDIENELQQTPLDLLDLKKQYDKIIDLINDQTISNIKDINMRIGNKKITLLHYAVDKNKYAETELLLGKKADLNIQDEKGYTPLHYAINKNYYDIVKLLLDKEAKHNIPNQNKYIPLHYAISKKYYDIAKLLLKKAYSPHSAPFIFVLIDKYFYIYWFVYMYRL